MPIVNNLTIVKAWKIEVRSE